MNFIQKNANQSSINAFILDKASEGQTIIERNYGFWSYRTPEELKKIHAIERANNYDCKTDCLVNTEIYLG